MTNSLTKQSRVDGVIDALRGDIIAGIFGPDERLTEDRLSERYGVSRTPVREALRGLEAEGFVTIRPYRGAQVGRLSTSDALDLLKVRQVIETVATQRAASRGTSDAQQRLVDILGAGHAAISAGTFEDLNRLNSDLHVLLVAMSCNQNLVVLYDQIEAKARWIYSVGTDERAAESWHEHDDIVAAVLAGDAEIAGDLAQHHVTRAIHHLKAHPPREVSAMGRTVGDGGPASSWVP